MRLHRFAFVSGLAMTMDIGIMSTLVWHGTSTFLSSIVGASVGICFVFMVSQRKIFVHDGRFLILKFCAYYLFQSLLVLVAAAWIQEASTILVETGWLPLLFSAPTPSTYTVLASLLAKGMIAPFTLYSNFLFMGWLLERRISLL